MLWAKFSVVVGKAWASSNQVSAVGQENDWREPRMLTINNCDRQPEVQVLCRNTPAFYFNKDNLKILVFFRQGNAMVVVNSNLYINLTLFKHME